MDLPAASDDELSQPTRARLFGLLSELRRPAGTEELAARVELHVNGVRAHLERLREAGLVTRERTRQARGRPRDMWAIAAEAQPGGDPPSAYGNLSQWLARLVTPRKVGMRTVEATGREIGRELAPELGAASPEETMYSVLTSLGFQPRREVDEDGSLTYKLCNCPYRDAVNENQPVICALHRGMTRGLLDVIAPDTELAAFVPHDPYAAGCLVELRGGLAGEAAATTSR
jgi:predicted ArsR family transcriptional regulator